MSLGLPVFNGENYLRYALDSILAQTFRHWELIVSDNGSTDATAEICREYARRDARVRFHREERNRGATWNFNRVLALARGPLFRWTAHDDVMAPELLERCVEALAAHPEAVLCHPRTRVIGPDGTVLYPYQVRLRTDSPRASERFHDLICRDHACFQIFGLMRVEALRRTRGFGANVGADRNLLAELSLYGPFIEIPEYLFLRRDHPHTSTRQFPLARGRGAWFGPARARQFPMAARAAGYWDAVDRAPLDAAERLLCLASLAKWFGQRFRSRMSRAMVFSPARPVQAAAKSTAQLVSGPGGETAGTPAAA